MGFANPPLAMGATARTASVSMPRIYQFSWGANGRAKLKVTAANSAKELFW